MRYLKELIEHTKNKGIVNDVGSFRGKDIPHFWDAVKDCRPFVFSEDHGPENWNDPKVSTYHDERDLDSPFPVWSIECLNGPIAELESEKNKIQVFCIIVKEYEPKKYGYFTYTRFNDEFYYVFSNKSDGKIPEYYLNRLKNESSGIENVRERIKIGSGKGKEIHTIRRIVHVRPKKYQEPSSIEGRAIDWKHRWEVRGHWRKVEGGLGKDRAGDYCVSGYTWVVDFIKGPEDAPLIKKTRLVERMGYGI
jgi:hypothetical protein